MKVEPGTDFAAIWPEVESTLMPMIQAMAQRYCAALGMDREDVVQEVRVALFQGFMEYDYNKSRGGIKAFARTITRNAIYALLYHATTQTRSPHTVYEEDGETKLARHRLASIDELELDMEGPEPDPERSIQIQRVVDKVSVLRLRLYRSLSRRERQVFRCKATPTEDFLLFLRNIGIDEATNPAIAEYLGISKNSVDWSIHKIKRAFAELAESPEFSVLIGDLVREGSWPMIHVSMIADDTNFIQQVIKEHKLDPRPLPERRDIQRSGDSARIIERYHWGAVLHLKHGEERATLVIQGNRFNPATGEVFGDHGIWKSVTEVLPWYRQLAKDLNNP